LKCWADLWHSDEYFGAAKQTTSLPATGPTTHDHTTLSPRLLSHVRMSAWPTDNARSSGTTKKREKNWVAK